MQCVIHKLHNAQTKSFLLGSKGGKADYLEKCYSFPGIKELINNRGWTLNKFKELIKEAHNVILLAQNISSEAGKFHTELQDVTSTGTGSFGNWKDVRWGAGVVPMNKVYEHLPAIVKVLQSKNRLDSIPNGKWIPKMEKGELIMPTARPNWWYIGFTLLRYPLQQLYLLMLNLQKVSVFF